MVRRATVWVLLRKFIRNVVLWLAFWTQPLGRINLICVNGTLYYTVTCCYIKVQNISCWDNQCFVEIIMVARRKTTGLSKHFLSDFLSYRFADPILLQSNYESPCWRSPDKVIHYIRGIVKKINVDEVLNTNMKQISHEYGLRIYFGTFYFTHNRSKGWYIKS